MQYLSEDPDVGANERCVLSAMFVSEPVDKANARIQHLDDTGESLEECQSPDGPIANCLKHLWGLMHVCSDDGAICDGNDRAALVMPSIKCHYTERPHLVQPMVLWIWKH